MHRVAVILESLGPNRRRASYVLLGDRGRLNLQVASSTVMSVREGANAAAILGMSIALEQMYYPSRALFGGQQSQALCFFESNCAAVDVQGL